jgi:hypothetical protein
MDAHQPPIIGVRLALLAAFVLWTPADAAAQRGLDRALTTSRPAQPQGAKRTLTVGADTDREASWLLQPLLSVSDGGNDLGLLGGYRNINRFTPWYWQFTARGMRRYEDNAAHFRWQVDGEIYPPIGIPLELPVELMIAATLAHTLDVGHSEVIAAELDWLIRDNSSTRLSLGVVGYYDWESPQHEESSDGPIGGLVGYWKHRRYELVTEYDFSSEVAGGDGYSVAGSIRLSEESSKRELRLRGGWEKGDIFSLRLELGIPDNKPASRPGRF